MKAIHTNNLLVGPYDFTRFVGDGSHLMSFFQKRLILGIRVNGEAQYALTEFELIHRWRIRIDGALFGDGGGVFIDEEALSTEFGLNQDIINQQTSGFQYSFGCGVRIAMAQSLLARIDVGFREEEKGLVYLSFGQMF